MLVTSLVFLVVITLLAVSAINSSTIQERMASNQREKSRALQAADSTLHVGETIFHDPVFDLQQPPGSSIEVTVATSPSNEKLTSIKLWRRDDMLLDKDNASAFLDKAIWNKTQTLAYEVDNAGTQLDPVQYYVEDYECLRNNLSAEAGAYCDGAIVYRVTARATGENPAAIAVTQSLYEKQY